MSADGAAREAANLKAFRDAATLIQERDGDKIAQAVFAQLGELGPLSVPEPFVPFNADAIERWRKGEPVKDEEIPDLAQWLEHTQRRSKAIAENARRLHATTWAQRRMRGKGDDYAQRFAAFHRESWGLVLGDDYEENERQLLAAARRGLQIKRRS